MQAEDSDSESSDVERKKLGKRKRESSPDAKRRKRKSQHIKEKAKRRHGSEEEPTRRTSKAEHDENTQTKKTELSPKSIIPSPAASASALAEAARAAPESASRLTVSTSPALSPRLAACRTLPLQYRTSLDPRWGDGERLKPGLNISPRKLEKSPASSPASSSIGPAWMGPPSFRLDGGLL